jgi:copper ion binding protein
MSHKTINVPNISCGHCVMTIERELGELDGVTAVQADAATKQVSVEWSEDETDFSAVLDLLDEIGFPAAR